MDDAQGVGLAATQVGVLQRLFVFSPGEEGARGRQPAPASTCRRDRDRRGGLPVAPGRARAGASARQASRSRVSTRRAPPVRFELEGLGARVVQHELDHLDGVLIIDRTDEEHRKEALGAAAPADRPALMRLAVAATAAFGAAVLEGLAAQPRGRVSAHASRRAARPRAEARRAAGEARPRERLGIPVLQPERPELPDEPVDAVVVCAYGLLIPAALLERALWLNVHPSLLPRWRGAAPVERAILAGDEETGVTIHETVEALDAGPIAAQEAFPIGARGRRCGLRALRRDRGAAARCRARGADRSRPQPAEGATYAEKIGPTDRQLDLGDPLDAWRRVRALSPHIGAWTTLQGRRVTIWRARLEDGAFVPEEVQPEGKRRMAYDEFLRGLRS